MVAAVRSTVVRAHAPAAKNGVRRHMPSALAVVAPSEARQEARARVAVPSWVCGEEHSARGYALDLSTDGARFGGVGSRFPVGTHVIVKLVLEAHEAPVVLPARVVRYQPASSCPDLCVRFLDAAPTEERFRVNRFLAKR